MNFRRHCVSATLTCLAAVQPLRGQNVAEVQVAPAAVSIKVGERTGLLATAFDRIGNVIPTATADAHTARRMPSVPRSEAVMAVPPIDAMSVAIMSVVVAV